MAIKTQRGIVSRQREAIRSADDADERQWLANRCDHLGPKPRKAWDHVLRDLQDARRHDALRNAIEQAEEDDKLSLTPGRLDRCTRGTPMPAA